MIKISIITVCKNAEPHIKTCLESIINQTYTNYEYIIIDGKSEDGTINIINQYSTHINKLISEPDDGLYQAMNKGVKLATGDFIYFLNSDDYLCDTEVLKDVVAILTAQPEADFLYGNMQLRNTSGQISIHVPPSPQELQTEMIFSCAIPHPTSFFKADLFTKLGMFDESYQISGDYEWFTRLLKNNNLKLVYSDRLISSYYCGGISGINLRLAYQEVFKAQNSSSLYSNYDADLRINKLQQFCVDQQELIGTLRKLSEDRQGYIDVLERYILELTSSITNFKQLNKKRRLIIVYSGLNKILFSLKTLFKKLIFKA